MRGAKKDMEDNFPFDGVIFRFHVNFLGCRALDIEVERCALLRATGASRFREF